MTTKGHARHNDLGLEAILGRLPDMIERAHQDGRHVIVEHPAGSLHPATQRLYASLGVLVRFTPEAEASTVKRKLRRASETRAPEPPAG